jgi:hypothetical protein
VKALDRLIQPTAERKVTDGQEQSTEQWHRGHQQAKSFTDDILWLWMSARVGPGIVLTIES